MRESTRMTQAKIDFLQSLICEPQKSLPNDLDRDTLESILVELGGFFWYRCVIRRDSPPFLHGDRSRSGWVLFVPVFEGGKLVVYIFGLRLASSKNNGPSITVEKPWPWNGKGSIVNDGGEFEFTWKNKYEQGTNTEKISLDLRRSRWTGMFEHLTRDGCFVEGSVNYERILLTRGLPKDERGNPWIPEGTHPQFRLGLDPADEQLAEWGTRLYNNLEPEEKGTESEPLVFIELVSRDHIRASRNHLVEASQLLREKHPYPVFYLAQRNNEPLITMGVSPSR